MYLEHFGQSAPPFQFTASPMALFMSRTHREVMAALEWGLLHEPSGLTLLIGDSGTGKTTLVCALLARQYRDVRAAYLGNPKLSFTELLGSILSQLGIRGGRSSKAAMINAFTQFAADLPLNERLAILIDEAQTLSDDALEDFRLLSNLERHGGKAAQIVLAGQYELARRLSDPAMRHFNERIGARAVLLPLSALETRDYIEHRLRLCHSTSEKIFVRRALDYLVRQSAGVPRRINALCHNALLLAYSSGAKRVTAAMAKEAAADYAGIDEVRGEARGLFARARDWTRSMGPVVGVGLLGVAGFLSGQVLMHHDRAPHLNTGVVRMAAKPDAVAEVEAKVDRGAKIVIGTPAAHAAEQSPPHDESNLPRGKSSGALDDLRPVTPERGSESTIGADSVSKPATPTAPAGGVAAASTGMAVAAASSGMAAAAGKPPSERPFIVVTRGDTLSLLALRHLGSVDAWPDLMRINPHINNAARLYPGEVVYLPPSPKSSSTHNTDDTDVE